MTFVTVLGLRLVLLVVATVAGVSVAVLSSGLLCPGLLTVVSRTGIVLLSSSCPGLLTVVSRAGTVLLSSSCPGLLTAVSRIGTELLSSLCPGLLAVGVSHIGTEPTTLGVSTSGGGGGRGERPNGVGHSLSALPFAGVVFRLTSTLVKWLG